ncbi:MAG: response regulator transcription factor [Candidatus Dormibacteraeota bacterium]|nr:response regulator transcription factor [Candidatus Dormibacteraeota bacterium]
MAQVTESRPTQTRVYRVLLADGSPMFRRGLSGLLNGHAELEVVGEAGEAAEVLRAARRLRPDVVVLDAGIPGGCEEAAGELLEQAPEVAILTLSSTGSTAEAARALGGGASGYVLKEAEPELLAAAIIAAAHGYAVSPRPMMHEIGRAGTSFNQQQQVNGLSPREFQVLRDLADGMTTKMLAGRMGISEKTVRNHIASMYAKLGLHDRSQLVRYAIQRGLCRPLS